MDIVLTSDQQTVFDWIKDDLELPVHADVYKGALGMLEEKLPGYIPFVCHAGRDLMNSLAAAVNGTERKQVQYVQLVDKFKDDWKQEWGAEGLNATEGPDGNGHLIPNEVCEKIKKLVDEHTAGRRRAEDAKTSFFTTFLEYRNKESIPNDLRQRWRDTHRWFQEHTHLRDKEFGDQVSDEIEKCFKILDGFLFSAAESTVEQLRSLHEILEETN